MERGQRLAAGVKQGRKKRGRSLVGSIEVWAVTNDAGEEGAKQGNEKESEPQGTLQGPSIRRTPPRRRHIWRVGASDCQFPTSSDSISRWSCPPRDLGRMSGSVAKIPTATSHHRLPVTGYY